MALEPSQQIFPEHVHCHAHGSVPVGPGCPILGRALRGSLAWTAPGKGFSMSPILRMHRWPPQCSHTAPEGHLLDSDSHGCLTQLNALHGQVHWGHHGGEADNVGLSEGPLPPKILPHRWQSLNMGLPTLKTTLLPWP